MHQVYISLPFFIKHDKKKEFFEFCNKKKIQVISEVHEYDGRKEMEAWTPDKYHNVSVRFKDTAKFDLSKDKEFCTFIDERNVMFFRLIISGKYDRRIEIYNLKFNGEFTKCTPDWYNINHMTMLDLGWIVNQTCHFGFNDLYIPAPKTEQPAS